MVLRGRRCYVFVQRAYREYVLRTRFSADWRRADAEVLAAMTGEFVMKNITDIILRIAMIPRGCITVHSSSLAYNGRGLMFSAPSGTGKSTHTGLWQKYRPGTIIVNDDMPMINTNGEIALCGTPFAGTTGINTNINVPLAAVVFLRRAAGKFNCSPFGGTGFGVSFRRNFKIPRKRNCGNAV